MPLRTFKVYGHYFHIDDRFSPIKPLGRGAYGVVCACRDRKTGKNVAIKKICPMARTEVDAKHTLREVRLMRLLGRHRNIITLRDLACDRSDDALYIVMELMDTDLHRIIQSSQPLSNAHHKFFMFQLLQGVKFALSEGVLHRDLKPANLLVTKSCELRISDFGLARMKPDESADDPCMTEHVVTRWYRAPELMLSPDGKYTSAVDMWSAGCIFAELLGRTPLFPGRNFVHQLTLIFDVIGTPSLETTAFIKNQQAVRFLRSLAPKRAVPFGTLFPFADPQAIELLEGLLVFDPKKRMTVDAALSHRYFEDVLGKDRYDAPVEVPGEVGFEFEKQSLTRTELIHLIVEEVAVFKREKRLRIEALRSKKIERTSSAPSSDDARNKKLNSTPSDGSLDSNSSTGSGTRASTASGSQRTSIMARTRAQLKSREMERKAKAAQQKYRPLANKTRSLYGQKQRPRSNYGRNAQQTGPRKEPVFQSRLYKQLHGRKGTSTTTTSSSGGSVEPQPTAAKLLHPPASPSAQRTKEPALPSPKSPTVPAPAEPFAAVRPAEPKAAPVPSPAKKTTVAAPPPDRWAAPSTAAQGKLRSDAGRKQKEEEQQQQESEMQKSISASVLRRALANPTSTAESILSSASTAQLQQQARRAKAKASTPEPPANNAADVRAASAKFRAALSQSPSRTAAPVETLSSSPKRAGRVVPVSGSDISPDVVSPPQPAQAPVVAGPMFRQSVGAPEPRQPPRAGPKQRITAEPAVPAADPPPEEGGAKPRSTVPKPFSFATDSRVRHRFAQFGATGSTGPPRRVAPSGGTVHRSSAAALLMGQPEAGTRRFARTLPIKGETVVSSSMKPAEQSSTANVGTQPQQRKAVRKKSGRRKLTVPQSPNFSTFSWMKKRKR